MLGSADQELIRALKSLLETLRATQCLLGTIIDKQVELKADLAETNTSLATLIIMVGKLQK